MGNSRVVATPTQQDTLAGAVVRSEALATGLTPGVLRGPSVGRPFRGVYCLPHPRRETVWRASLLAAGPEAHLCDVSGLALVNVDVPRRLAVPGLTHVWVPAHQVGPRMPGIRVHRSRRQYPPSVRDGISSLDPAECWLQLAARGSWRELVVVGDALCRRKDPSLTTSDLGRCVMDSHQRPGLVRARRAAAFVRDGTESPMETWTRLAFVEAGLPEPEVNVAIYDDAGQLVYLLDMAYRDRKLAIEYDGAVHVADVAQMQRDATRRRHLEDLGWRVITVTAADAQSNFAGVIASVRAALRD